MKKIKIKNNIIQNNLKCFVIAEIGLSHDGSLGIAKNLIDRAKKSGADAVKFQMHISEFESSDKEKFRKKFSFQDKTRYEYWKRTSFSLREWNHIKQYCEKKNIIFLCSPFSVEAVKILRKIKVEAWKIASGEFNNLILLNEVIKDNRPIILSTGLTEKKEINKIIKFIRRKNKKIILLACYSNYPTKLIKAGHQHISYFNKTFNVNSGISDHTGNLASLLSSIAAGASVIETHVAIDKFFFGPDTSSSIDFDELKILCNFNAIHSKIKEFNFREKNLDQHQKKMRKIFNKGLYAKRDLKKNDIIKYSDLIALKPKLGIPVYDYKKILGKKLKRDIKKNQYFTRDVF